MSKMIIRELETYFPSVAKDAVTITEHGPFELIVQVTNGAIYSYDDFSKTIRRLPNHRNELTEDEFRREFGIRLRKILDRKGMSQTKLSFATGISQIGISKYVNGTRTPSFYTVDKIAKALGCSTEEFRY